MIKYALPGILDIAGDRLGHLVGSYVPGKDLGKSRPGKHQITEGRMIDGIAVVSRIFGNLIQNLVGLCGHLDLIRRSGQTDHPGMHVVSPVPERLGRIAARVDTDEDRGHLDALFVQNVDGFGIARGIDRANVRAISVAEIDKAGFGKQIRVCDCLANNIKNCSKMA